jgi:hypothetical protein
MRRKLLKTLALGATLSVSSVFAANVPGGTAAGTPTVFTLAGLTQIVTASGTFSPPSLTFNADYRETVYSDPSNEFCSGCYDFVIQIHDTGANNGASGIIEHVTNSDFSQSQVDIGYTTSTLTNFTAGGVVPNTIDRQPAAGNVVSWDYNTTPIAVGQYSAILVAETNAKSYTVGFLGTLDGGSAQAITFAPSSVPEPMSMGLIGGGLALLGAARWRRKAKA